MEEEIEKIGLKLINDQKLILNLETILLIDKILIIFKNWNENFEFYDIKYPSPSAIGAYFSYSFSLVERKWKMTLGNHGWSGGIYTIENKVLINQIQDIIKSEEFIEINLFKTSFFSGYQE